MLCTGFPRVDHRVESELGLDPSHGLEILLRDLGVERSFVP
jgi:hypothetical protein